MPMEERRKEPRYQIWLPVRLEVAGTSLVGHMHDLSRCAAFVEVEGSWPVGTELTVTAVLVAAASTVDLPGRVVRVGTGGVAVEFTDLTPTAAAWIDMFLAGQR
jgi:hypothetical protein